MESREALADTSGLYSLIVRQDPGHEDAQRTVADLIRTGRRLVATDYVVAETINLANARGGPAVALRVLDLFDRSRGIRIEWIGADRFDRAKSFLRRHSDHGYSFTDCTSFVVMQELKLVDVLTQDRHFRAAGFRPLLETT